MSPKAEEDGDVLEFRLGFAGSPCPGCGTIGEAGPCAACGLLLPATGGPSGATLGRREALLPLRDEAEATLAAFDDLPPPRIPVSASVLLSGFTEADLFSRVLDVNALGRELGNVDLDDETVIRGVVVDAIRVRLAGVSLMLDACRELAQFRTSPPADQLREIAARLGQRAARLLLAFLAALTAIDGGAARDAQTAIQAELNGFDDADSLSAILDQLGLSFGGTNERVSAALGRGGEYTDVYGSVDPARVFWAFRGSENPFAAVGIRAAQYFAPLIAVDLDLRGDHAAVALVFPLLHVISLDRPLLAHRLVRETHELFRAAATTDPAEVRRLAAELVRGQADLLHARERSRVVAAERPNGSPVVPGAALGRLLSTYRSVAETHLGLAKTMNRLAAVAETDPAAISTFDNALEPILCRPEGEFGWDDDGLEEQLVHVGSARRWTLSEFEAEFDRLLSAVGGADAGITLGLVSERMLEGVDVESPGAAELLSSALLGPAGATVVDVAPDASVITIAPIDRGFDVQRLLSATAGLSAAFPSTDNFTLRTADGATVVTISADTMHAAQHSPPAVRDLAIVVACHESRVARGESPTDVARHLAAVQTHLVAMGALGSLAAPELRSVTHREVVEQLSFVGNYVRRHGDRKLFERLGRARASAALAARGDWAAHRRAVDQLTSLASWSRGAGATVSWF